MGIAEDIARLEKDFESAQKTIEDQRRELEELDRPAQDDDGVHARQWRRLHRGVPLDSRGVMCIGGKSTTGRPSGM